MSEKKPRNTSNNNNNNSNNNNNNSSNHRHSPSTSKSLIAAPPRVALSRSKPDNDDNASIKSSTPSERPYETEDAPPSASSSEAELSRRKILSLEAEIDIMNSEFSRELTLLSHKLTNERDTSSFWQKKHSSLHISFLQTDTDLRILKPQLKAAEELERDLRTKVSSLQMDRDAFRDAYNEAMREMREKEEVVGMLRGQVRGLKSWVSERGRAGEEQVSDEVVGEGWGRLGNGLQNWVIVHFRRVKIDIDKPPNPSKEELLHLIPTYTTLAPTSKINFIQSLISRILVLSIFNLYFVGIPLERAEELEKIEMYLRHFGSIESMNQYRSTTLSILRKEAPTKLQAETEVLVEEIISRINNITSSISDIAPSESRDASLRTLINSSIDLSRLLRSQKAVFTVTMPELEGHLRTMFDHESMEDIGGEDEETLNEREIQCVTFPGIIKAGDENGERGHLRNIVAKIMVLCAPD